MESEGRRSLRELFPQARLVCECVEDREVCPAGCPYLLRMRKVIRDWYEGCEG